MVIGLVASLTRIVGNSIAGYWLLAKPRIDPDQAQRWGFFHETVTAEALHWRVAEIASDVARGAPLGLRLAKESIKRGRDLPMQAALELEADLYSLLQLSLDRATGVAAFLEHRDPLFTGD